MKPLIVGVSILCVLMLYVPLVLSQAANGTTENNDGADTECVHYPKNITKVAHIGWPYIFECEVLARELVRNNRSIYQAGLRDNWICELKFSNGTKLLSINDTLKKLQFPDYDKYDSLYSGFIVQKNMDTRLKMSLYSLKTNFCAGIDLYLVPEEDTTGNETCEAVKEQLPSISDKRGLSGRLTIACTAPKDPGLHFPVENATYEWWQNCSKNLPSNVEFDGDKLRVNVAKFENAGEYVCAVTYNGKRKYVKRHRVCIEHRNAGVITIKCPDEVIGEIGEDLNVTCNVDMGIGNIPTIGAFTETRWFNGTNGTEWKSCQTRTYLHANGFEDDRVMCESNATGIIGTQKCHYVVPSLEEQRPVVQTFDLTMQIRNLQMWDAGLYNVYFSRFFMAGKNDTVMITIRNDKRLRFNAKVLAISLTIVVLIIILIALCIWRKVDIKWFFKKYIGEYDIDDKTYLAYLAYHYSTENMDNESKEMTENLVRSLYDFMEGMGGRVYDDHRDGDNGQLHIENVSLIQKDCHRIIVILNEEYVTDQWNLHEAYSAIRNMILDGKKVIFIPLPGIEKKFKEMADESKTALTRAMQVNTTIKWNGKIPFSSTFRHQLQCALPKLKKRRDEEVVLENPLIREAAV